MPYLRIYNNWGRSEVIGEVRCEAEKGLTVFFSGSEPDDAADLLDKVAAMAAKPHLTLQWEESNEQKLTMMKRFLTPDEPDYLLAVLQALQGETHYWLKWLDDEDNDEEDDDDYSHIFDDYSHGLDDYKDTP